MDISEVFKSAKDFIEEYGDVEEIRKMAKDIIVLLKVLKKGKSEKAFKVVSKWKDVAETIKLAEEIRFEGYKQLLASKFTDFLGNVLKLLSVIIK